MQRDDQAPEDQRDHGRGDQREERSLPVFQSGNHGQENLSSRFGQPLMRSFGSLRKGRPEFVTSVSAARVTLEHGGLAVTDLSHDLDGPVAVGTKRHLRSRQERDDPQGPLTPAALGRRSQSDTNYRGWLEAGARLLRSILPRRETPPATLFGPKIPAYLAREGKTGQPRGYGRSWSGRSPGGDGSRQRSASEQATRRSIATLRVAVTARSKCGQ